MRQRSMSRCESGLKILPFALEFSRKETTMRRILCTVIFVCAAVTLAAEPKEAEKSAPLAEPAATADVQQILKDRFREYTEALTKRDLAALDKNLGRGLHLHQWPWRIPHQDGPHGEHQERRDPI